MDFNGKEILGFRIILLRRKNENEGKITEIPAGSFDLEKLAR